MKIATATSECTTDVSLCTSPGGSLQADTGVWFAAVCVLCASAGSSFLWHLGNVPYWCTTSVLVQPC